MFKLAIFLSTIIAVTHSAIKGGMLNTDQDSISSETSTGSSSSSSYVSLTTEEFMEEMANLYANNFLEPDGRVEDEVDAPSISEERYHFIGDDVRDRGQPTATTAKQQPELAEVFCNYGVEEHNKKSYPPGLFGKALCVSKIPNGDFTEIFLHDFNKMETETCQVFTFTPLHVSKKLKEREYTKEEIKRAWKEGFKRLKFNPEVRWQFNPDASKKDLDKLTQIIFADCNIDLEFFNPHVSAIYMDQLKNDKLSIAFFSQSEKPPVDVTFTKISPAQYDGSRKQYISADPPLRIEVDRQGTFYSAVMYFDNKPIEHAGSRRGVRNLHAQPEAKQIYRIKYEATSQSMDQMFFYHLFAKADVMYGMMRYKNKWAILHERELPKSYETTV